MKTAHAQAVVVAADSNTLSRIARDCKQQGLSPRWVSFGIALVNSVAADPNLDGLVGTSSTFPWFLTNGPGAAYGQAMSTYAPSVVLSGTTADVWVGGAMMQEASKKLPAGAVKSSDILEGLYTFHGNTVGGLTPARTFRRVQPAPPIACYLTVALQGGHFNAPGGFNFTCT